MPIRTMAALIALLLALIPAQRADGDACPTDAAAAHEQYEVNSTHCAHITPEHNAYAHAHSSHFSAARTHADMLRRVDNRKSAQHKIDDTAHASAASESDEQHIAAVPTEQANPAANTSDAQHAANTPTERPTTNESYAQHAAAAPTERAQPAATVPYANLHPAKPASSPPPASNTDYLTSVPEGTAELPGSMPLSEFAPPEPGAFFDPESDMGIAIGESWYPIMRDFSALREALGEPLDIVLTDSCNHPGLYDKEYVYEFGSVYTHPEGDADIWYELFVYGDGITTSRGITNGSTLDDMLTAYGQEYYPDSAVTYIYTLSGREQDFASPAITFEVSDDRVIYFDIFYPIYEN